MITLRPYQQGCSILGCSEISKIRGFCGKHYFGQLYSGKIKKLQRKTPEERFWSKVDKDKNGCWEWTGTILDNGYGQFFYMGKNVGAHRFCYANFVGEIPDKFYVCHSCDNPSCVNPDHLFTGTPLDNMIDKVQKNRHYYGMDQKKSKLTDNDVKIIRLLISLNVKQKEIAKIYNISETVVSKIKLKKLWKHVT